MYRKKKVNTGITRIFRQHKFLEFRNLNVYDENPNSNFDFWYLFLFYEVVAESKITLWMDIRIIGIVGKLKPDILKAHCQSIHGPIERNYNDWNGLRTNKCTPCYKESILGLKWTISGINFFCRFLLRLSENNHSRVMFMAKFGPTASNFCYENFHDFF